MIELWLAAANQPELSFAVFPEVLEFDAGTQPLAAQLFPEVAQRLPDFPVYVSLLFQSLQGMGLAAATLPEDDAATGMRARVRALLSRLIAEAFARGGPDTDPRP